MSNTTTTTDVSNTTTDITSSDQTIGILVSIFLSILFTGLLATFAIFTFHGFTGRFLNTTQTIIFTIFCLIILLVGSVLIYNTLSQRRQQRLSNSTD